MPIEESQCKKVNTVCFILYTESRERKEQGSAENKCSVINGTDLSHILLFKGQVIILEDGREGLEEPEARGE